MGGFGRAIAVDRAGEVFLGIEEAIEHVKVLTTRMSFGSHQPPSVGGVLNAALQIGSRQDLSYVLLHLPNFIKYPARIVLEADGVRTTIEPVEDCERLTKELEGVGGYAITHVGKLEATSGNLLPVSMVESTLLSLFPFLSFVCGSRVQPILPVGHNAEGDVVWKKWANWQIDSWQSSHSPWCDVSPGGSIGAVFRGFMARYRTPVWEKPLTDAIHWYVVSNRRQGLYVEDAVVLTQAALEMLAWVVLVEDPETAHFAPDQFDRLNAAQKLRCLLNWAGIPRAIPPETQELGSIATSAVRKRKRKRKGEWQRIDGPEACTAIRNCIVHATQEKRSTMEEIPSMAPVKACILALWYLELVLLRLFDYSGVYTNRLKRGVLRCDAVQRVPWAAEDAAPTE